jgi:hypothetical protein
MKCTLAAAATVAIAAATLTACGRSSSAPATGMSAGNALVCQHYLAQRDWVKHLTYPTVADALKFEGYVTVDAAQSTGKLHADLAALEAAQRDGGPVYAASTRVLDDCTS